MRRATGIMLVAITTAALLGGCALRDVRNDSMYSRSSDGLWNADYGLIDWNFPTSQNQPPPEGPKRLQPERTAIGVTWLTTDSWPYYRSAQGADAKARATAKADERGAASAAATAGTVASNDAAAGSPAAAAPAPAAAPAAPAGGANH